MGVRIWGSGPLNLTPAAIALLSDPGKEQAAVVERVLRPYLMHLNQIVERLIDINDHIEDTEAPLPLAAPALMKVSAGAQQASGRCTVSLLCRSSVMDLCPMDLSLSASFLANLHDVFTIHDLPMLLS